MRPDHPALVALRQAAVEWYHASRWHPLDPYDRAFKKVDRKLQRAARRFVRAKRAFADRLVVPKPRLTLPGGQEVIPYTVKCYRPGCRRRKRGYLTIHRSHLGGGAFYNKRGKLLADLREQNFACSEHGVQEPAFLYRDTDG